MWVQNLGSHNWRPSVIGSRISCLNVSVTLCLVFLAPIARCASWEALPVQCFQLKWIAWECLSYEIGSQPYCIKLTQKFKLHGILKQYHHTWPQRPLLVSLVKGNLQSTWDGVNMLGSHPSPLIKLLKCCQPILQWLSIREMQIDCNL